MYLQDISFLKMLPSALHMPSKSIAVMQECGANDRSILHLKTICVVLVS